ncbi:prolyl 4-hydroxylase subunit alpha-1 [Aplysia californica]|uniref:Prolyl 4-hydroxylase subunit alpha-1 n=1 Tax=Aplysia californica TaxID=6500 RepID=A0ABM0ZV38_APLCA|nr:prolyl 4-hydroxylase subunit alpha-1 [Aplysia californica]
MARVHGQENTKSLQFAGDRLATWMFYMSDVTAGGATVFPSLNVFVQPVKCSAVFWHNLLASGQPDTRMVHAGCPVLMGDKWVSNKWIRESCQVFRSPCVKTAW